jgi:hypothetical protein
MGLYNRRIWIGNKEASRTYGYIIAGEFTPLEILK